MARTVYKICTLQLKIAGYHLISMNLDLIVFSIKKQYFNRNLSELDRLQNILSFLEINQHSTIKNKYLSPFFFGVHNSQMN